MAMTKDVLNLLHQTGKRQERARAQGRGWTGDAGNQLRADLYAVKVEARNRRARRLQQNQEHKQNG